LILFYRSTSIGLNVYLSFRIFPTGAVLFSQLNCCNDSHPVINTLRTYWITYLLTY